MAASLYECDYLLRTLEEQFLICGGDVAWLVEGLRVVDPKLARIAELNEYMAFKPWQIDSNLIENLLQGDVSEMKWSIPELLQGGAILAHYHSLCGLIFG